MAITNDQLISYSMQLGYLGILLTAKLITQEEYDSFRKRLKKDYGIASDFMIQGSKAE